MTGKLLGDFIIHNCYDSHVHWQATGQQLSRFDLSVLNSSEEVQTLRPEHLHFRGQWLVGYGWDENLWSTPSKPTRQILDQCFPGVPVKFMRADMHAAWVSTEALKRAGLFFQNVADPDGGRIEKDGDGWPTGLLIDLAMEPVNNLIPDLNAEQIYENLRQGVKVFNRAGFTHIRDMTCDETEWQQKVRLAESGEMSLAVEQNFHCKSPDGFDRALALALAARKRHPKLLRPMGPKVFLDGALGSEGAYISSSYASGSGRGFTLIERIALKEILTASWAEDLHLSVHCIGDEAAHLAVTVACELWDLGHEGVLNIEHAQMLRPDTILKMRGRSVRCFQQPCHWLTDRRWLKQKIPGLFHTVFPWAALEDADIAFYFGSDAPIEPASIGLSVEAVRDAAVAGIRPVKKQVHLYHTHPDPRWVEQTYSRFENGQPAEVVFQGQPVENFLN